MLSTADGDRIGGALKRIPPVLNHPVTIVFTLFLLIALQRSVAHVMTSGEANTMLYAKQWVDPSFLPGDWQISAKPAVRIPFEILISPLVSTLPLPVAVIVGRLLVFFLFALGLGLVCKRLGIDALTACVVLGLFMLLDQSFPPSVEWILKKLESKVVAYGCLVLALYALMRKHLVATALVSGLATTMHVLVGGWGTLALGLAVLRTRAFTRRQVLGALALWALAASPVIYMSVSFFIAEAGADTDVSTSVVFFRNAHRLNPGTWTIEAWAYPLAGVFFWVLLRVRRYYPDCEAAVPVASFALFTLVPFGLGLLLWRTPWAASFLKYHPFRIGGVLFLLFGLVLTVPITLRLVLRNPARQLILAALVIYFFVASANTFVGGVQLLREFPEGAVVRNSRREAADLYLVGQWVRENTPPGALLIATPRYPEITWLCRRPVVVRYKDEPASAPLYEEWLRRLVDFNGGTRPRYTGFKADKEINRNFIRLREAEYLELGLKYGGRFLLVGERRKLQLPLLFRAGKWSVYALESTRRESR